MAAEAGLDEDERFHIAMAVREAAVNAVLHGNEYDPARQIEVLLENTGKTWSLPSPTRARASIPNSCPIRWRRKTCSAAPAAASSSSGRSWMRYTFDNCIPGPS